MHLCCEILPLMGQLCHLLPIEFLPLALLREILLHKICTVLNLREKSCIWLCTRQPTLPFTPPCQAELLPGLLRLGDGMPRTPPQSYCTGRLGEATPHSAMSSLKRSIMFFIFALPPTTLPIPVSAGVCV